VYGVAFSYYFVLTIQELVFQWKVGHVLHRFLFSQNGADNGEAKGAEKQQQGDYAKPLYALDRLKQVFVHLIEL
jgi:hypothetical protein